MNRKDIRHQERLKKPTSVLPPYPSGVEKKSPPPDITDKDYQGRSIELLMECRKAYNPDKDNKPNSVWGFVYKHDGVLKTSDVTEHACFAGIYHQIRDHLKVDKDVRLVVANRAAKDGSGREWIESLFEPTKSAYKRVLPFVEYPECINEVFDHGFILKDLGNIEARLMYLFLIATRFHWENPDYFKDFLSLLQKGYEPRLATMVAVCFPEHNDRKTTLQGPPHSHLSSSPLSFLPLYTNGEPTSSKTWSEIYITGQGDTWGELFPCDQIFKTGRKNRLKDGDYQKSWTEEEAVAYIKEVSGEEV